MMALRELVRRYPVAAIAVVVGAVGLGGWTFYQSRQSQQPPTATVPSVPPPIGAAVTPTSPAGAAPGVTPTSPAGRAPAVTPTSPSGAAQGGAPTVPSGEGRANPFQPLAGPGGSGASPAPGGGGGALPPVPPLPVAVPAAPGPGAAPPVPPAPEYRLVGVLWGDTAFAILEDSQGSYIVGPGDTVKPGVRVAAIDVRREVVRLTRDGTSVDLTLSGAVRRSP